MTATIRVLSMAGAFLLVACSKPVDPAYLSEIESGAESICRCVPVPKEQRMDCRRGEKSMHPKAGPNGEPPGTYEMDLDEQSQHAIAMIRAKGDSCMAELLK